MTTIDVVRPAEGQSPDASWHRPTAWLARLLGITRGEATTLILGVTLVVVLTVGGITPVLRQRSSGEAAAPAPVVAPSPARPSRPAQAEPTIPAPSGRIQTPSAAAAPTFATAPVQTEARAEGQPASDRGPGRMASPPTGVVATFATATASPRWLAVDAEGTVFASTESAILRFRPDGSAAGQVRVAGVTGLLSGPAGSLVGAQSAAGQVVRIDAAGGVREAVATLFDLPACRLVVAAEAGCEPGIADDPPRPESVVYDAAGTLFITDIGQGTIWRVPRGGKPEPWLSLNEWSMSNGLRGIAFDGDGGILVTSPEPLDPRARDGAVYRIPVNGDGSPGEPMLIAAVNGGPTGLAHQPDGSIVVATSAGVVRIGSDGAVQPPVTGSGLTAPLGVALLGDTVLVANNDAARERWAVLAVGV